MRWSSAKLLSKRRLAGPLEFMHRLIFHLNIFTTIYRLKNWESFFLLLQSSSHAHDLDEVLTFFKKSFDLCFQYNPPPYNLTHANGYFHALYYFEYGAIHKFRDAIELDG